MRTRILGAVMFAVMCAGFLPAVSYADTSCTCFCGTPSEGAKEVGKKEDSNACITSCRDDGKEPVGCFTSEANYPEKDEMCWTQSQCLAGTQQGLGNTWDDDVAYCDDRKEHMGYCYAGQRTFTSIIAINGDNTFAGLADYISTLYKYLVPVMALVAIVMMMIAGLQYILSRGNPSAVKQAKERIVQAVVGIVLLLSAYTLARLLDPRLVSFTELRIPKVKEVVTLSTGSMCETLAMAGLEIDHVPGESFQDKTCSYEDGAEMGIVTDISKVEANVDIGQWKEGDKCYYSKCEDGAVCMSTGCVRCESVTITGAVTEDDTDLSESSLNNPFANRVTPSATTCAIVQGEVTLSTKDDENLCVYSEGGETLLAHFLPSCVAVPLECSALQSDAVAGVDGCTLYGNVTEKQSYWPWPTTGANVIDSFKVSAYAAVDPAVYEKICTLDPCGLAERTTCVFTATEDGGTCTSM